MTPLPDFADAPVVAARILVGLIFAHAAYGKLREPAVFRGVVLAYRLLPAWLAGALALALPPVEASLAALLLSGLFAPAPGLAAALLLGVRRRHRPHRGAGPH